MPTEYFPLEGGLDQASAPLAIRPGRLLNCVNWEIAASGKGYRLPEGYERFDGQTSPSDATFTRINFENGVIEISDGDTVDGSGSGASGVAIIDAALESGTYGGGDATGYIVLTTVSGTFVDTDDLEVGAVKHSEIAASGVQAEGSGAPDNDTDAAWVADCVAIARANILVVPGAGDILGVHRWNNVTYAFRNNAGETACDMYESSTAGWVKVDLGSQLNFDSGSVAFTVGDTVTGDASTANAPIQRVVVTTGSWSGGDAAGFLTIGTVTNSPFQAEAITDVAGGVADATGAEVANTFTVDGRFDIINNNFGGNLGTYNMYGVNGVDKAWEYDGTAFSFIATGMATDTPTHIAAHQNSLFLSFSGGSVQNSSLVDSPLTAPYVWSAVLGAAEFGMGDEVTALEPTAGETLTIFAKNLTKTLYGSSQANWNLQDTSWTAGAVEWTVQQINEPFYVDSRKITSLRATQVYGGFSIAGLGNDIQDFINLKSGLEIASVVSLGKSQYRVFYSDGYFISMSIVPQGIAGFMIGQLDDIPTCAAYDEENGRVFFGSDDGYVYEMDKGTSYDGVAVTRYMRIPFNFFKSPQNNKKFFKIIFEMGTEVAPSVSFNFIPEYDYMNSNVPTAETGSVSFQAGGLVWDVGEWDVYRWASDSDDDGRPEDYIDGIASEMAIGIYNISATQQPFTINGIFIEHAILGKKR